MEEAKLTAGDSTVDSGAIANTPDITKTPPVQAGTVSPGAQGSATFPQTTEVDEAKLAAGDPTEDNGAIAQATDIYKTPIPIQAGIVPPGAQGPAALPRTDDVGEAILSAGNPTDDEATSAQAEAAAMELADYAAASNASVDAAAAHATAGTAKVQMPPAQVQEQASSEVPPEPIAQEIQPESTAKEKVPTAPVDTATLVAALQTMQHNIWSRSCRAPCKPWKSG
jgi:hypothetical protein